MAIAEPGPVTVLPLSIEESARLVTGWARAESRLYEVVGGWAASAGAPAARICFDACSQHHAWRARLWEELRPGLPVHLAHCHGGKDGAWSTIDVLAGLANDGGRLGAYCRVVLPRLVLGYRYWQRRCSPVHDRPVARALGFALADVMADWERGSALLADLMSREDTQAAAAAAADASRQLDVVLARDGFLPDG